MEQTAQKIIYNAFITGAKLCRTKISQNGNYQHVPHNGSFRHARRLRPAFLKTQLPYKVNKFAGFAFQRYFLNAGQIIMVLDIAFNGSFSSINAVNCLIKMVDNAKFPLRGKIVCRPQKFFLQPVFFRIIKPAFKFIEKHFIKFRHAAFKLAVNPGIQLASVHAHKLMVNRRFNIG